MRVFVFGAGASKPAGLPLGRDLYGSLRAYILKRSGEDDGYSDVACRLKDLEQQGVLGNSDDFELDLTRLDVRIKSKDAPPLFRSVRQELADTLTDHFNALQNEIAGSLGVSHVLAFSVVRTAPWSAWIRRRSLVSRSLVFSSVATPRTIAEASRPK